MGGKTEEGEDVRVRGRVGHLREAREYLIRSAEKQRFNMWLEPWGNAKHEKRDILQQYWLWGRPAYAWVDIGAILGGCPDEGSLLLMGNVNLAVADVMAPKGRLWEAREALKRVSATNHTKLMLAPWPPRQVDWHTEGWSYWNDGKRVAKFDGGW